MSSYLVTGASRGLGYSWIKQLLAKTPQNTIYALVRNKASTEERLQNDGITVGGNIHVLEADITDLPTLKAAASQITSGRLDYLIHNAALVSSKSGFSTVLDQPVEELADDLSESFQANVVGTAYVLDTFLPLIRKGKEKKMVVISSGMADLELVNQINVAIAAPYSVSKAAANLLVAKYHAALGKKEGILFLSLSPGLVNTRETAPSDEEMESIKAMVAQFKTYAPHFEGPITAEESVEAQLAVIEKATVESFGGAFVSHHGNKEWL